MKVFLVACVQTSPISFVARVNNGNRRRLHAGNISRKYEVAQQLSFLFAFAFFYRYLHFFNSAFFVLDFHIDLVTVFDTILTKR